MLEIIWLFLQIGTSVCGAPGAYIGVSKWEARSMWNGEPNEQDYITVNNSIKSSSKHTGALPLLLLPF